MIRNRRAEYVTRAKLEGTAKKIPEMKFDKPLPELDERGFFVWRKHMENYIEQSMEKIAK